MKLSEAIDRVLTRPMSRVTVRPGNGLSSNMNRAIETYSQIPQIIQRTVECLAQIDYAMGFNDPISLHYLDLYNLLVHLHDDWRLEMPILTTPLQSGADPDAGATARPISFVTRPRLPLHQFQAAWSVARRLQLISGRGNIRLHSRALARLQALMTAGQPRTRSRDPPDGQVV